MFCIKCGAKNPDEAGFCIKCGNKLPTDVSEIYSSSDTQKQSILLNPQEIDSNKKFTHTASTPSPFLGCLSGYGAGGCMGCLVFVIGLLLCATGIGAVIGIPLILFAIVLPFMGSLFGATMTIKGPCPYCDTLVGCNKADKGVTCSACKKRILIRNGAFFRVD